MVSALYLSCFPSPSPLFFFFFPFFLAGPLSRNLDQGFPVTLPNGSKSTSRGLIIFGSLDLPAKADVQHFTHHNGHHGCPFCMNPGMNVSTESKKKSTVHVYSALKACQARSHKGTLLHAREALLVGGSRFASLFFLSFF